MSRRDHSVVDEIVVRALAEDLGVPAGAFAVGFDVVREALSRDVTTAGVVPRGSVFAGRIVAREAGIVCGLLAAERVFALLAGSAGVAGGIEFEALTAEGDVVGAGDAVARVSGDAAVILAGERTALNFLMVLSGIATAAARWQKAAGPGVAVFDTRKTLPGLRALTKWAVACGGAHPHRSSLWDMVLIKDNHVRLAGGLAAAVTAAREAYPELPIEAEADTVEQAAEAASAGADVVLLDNMDAATMCRAVEAVREASAGRETRCLTEASGGVTLERVPEIVATGVDRISTSALGLAPPLDFGFDEQTA
ncbi:MAG: carboxylating nicotinate-nucleotide diphosphorylase [Coriobacteriia bacterium]|nr:carboxylating nicotinate-nucleotide diphosphorylase [Coriobacteriia bacterium]